MPFNLPHVFKLHFEVAVTIWSGSNLSHWLIFKMLLGPEDRTVCTTQIRTILDFNLKTAFIWGVKQEAEACNIDSLLNKKVITAVITAIFE